MYTLKSIAQRSSMLGAAAALIVAAVIPAASVFADALNPLTERSLLLSSSAPGWQDTDGSGNSYAAPNSVGENYAPAGSGPNGKKSGETFTFTVSSTANVKGFSLQYCTSAAGLCQAPGDNLGDSRDGVATSAYPSTTPPHNDGRETNLQAHPEQRSDLDFVGTWNEGAGAGQYQVLVDDGTGYAASSGWTLTAAPLEDQGHSGDLTGKKNYITLAKTAGDDLNNGDKVQIVFRPSETTYITNPGSKEFFVKINTYSSATELFGTHNEDGVNNAGEEDHTVIDGGVTVANVMTDSIHITTKVLETMSFSVGTQNRDTMDIASIPGEGTYHGKCDPIKQTDNNRLQLGDVDAERSLRTDTAYDAHSYWRLSSNSSGGATVYYSGNTLANTVGDEIREMPNEVESTPGTEQFGLGFVDAGTDTLDTGAATWAPDYLSPSSYPFRTLDGQELTTEVDPGDNRDFTELATQAASDDYDEADGTITGVGGAPGEARFKFLKSSLTTPERIAQQNETVISCATAKMRYVANIGADTPAGVYTTKINYLAAPQY